jgi:phospholipid/cholesterol/gamma-HCH transport system substrate-binding protein
MRASHWLGTRIFLIGGLVLFAVGLFFIGNRQKLFTRTFDVYTEFDYLSGLQKGAKVRVSGIEAGEVLETQVPNGPDGRFRLKLRIQQNLHPLLRADSIATIKTMGLGGTSFLDVQKGTRRASPLVPGSTIPSQEPFDIADLMLQSSNLLKTTKTSIDDLRAEADRTLQSINSAAHRTDQTIAAVQPDLLKVVASARKTSQDVSEIVAQVQQGRGTVGKFLTDQKVADDVDQILGNTRQSVSNINKASARLNDSLTDFQQRDLLGQAEAVLANSRRVTEQVNHALTSFTSSPLGDANATANLQDALAGAQITMTNLAAETEALKHNFFLRGFFKKRGYFNLHTMTPAQYRSSKFVKGHSYERVWLSHEELFSSTSDDKEDLTKDGQRQIDTVMSALVPYLPNSPMVVEGYAIKGSPSERFLRAKQRASLVKSYIDKRFGLQPNTIGVMSMSDSPPSETGKPVWDGISLVLIAERTH